jgi:hypothetical protein
MNSTDQDRSNALVVTQSSSRAVRTSALFGIVAAVYILAAVMTMAGWLYLLGSFFLSICIWLIA